MGKCVRMRACVCVGVGARALVCARARGALLIQRAAHRHIAIRGRCGSTIFLTLSHKRHDLRKKLQDIKCVF